MLAGRLGDELLEPQAEPRQRLGDHERQLVAAGFGERAQRRTDPHPGGWAPEARPAAVDVRRCSAVPRHRCPSSSARMSTPISAAGTMPNGRQRAVAPADVRIAREKLAEAVLARELLQAGSGVGDRGEVATVADQRPEVREQRQRLDRATGLRGDQEQCLAGIDAAPARRAPSRRRSSPARAGAGVRAGRRTSAAEPRAPAKSRPCRAARRRAARRRAPARRRRSMSRPARASARRSSASRGGWRPPACPPGPQRRVTLADALCDPQLGSALQLAGDGGAQRGRYACLDGQGGVAHASIVLRRRQRHGGMRRGLRFGRSWSRDASAKRRPIEASGSWLERGIG